MHTVCRAQYWMLPTPAQFILKTTVPLCDRYSHLQARKLMLILVMLILMSKVIQLLAELKCESNLPGSEVQVLCRSIHVLKIV